MPTMGIPLKCDPLDGPSLTEVLRPLKTSRNDSEGVVQVECPLKKICGIPIPSTYEGSLVIWN